MQSNFLREQCLGFLRTPPLWLHKQFSIRQFEFPDVEMVHFVSRPIPDKIRLGHQMEHVFRQLIERSGAYEILVHNLPVKERNTTIGEIDFILRPIATGRYYREKTAHPVDSGISIHVELTYKFYIIDPDITEPIHRLMGPNKRDMFFTKLEKIKNRQFPLLHSSEGSKILDKNGIDHSKIEHQCCFKAQLFIPFSMKTVHIRPLNKACVSGFWLHFDDFCQREFRERCYYIPYKSEWVIAPHEEVVWQSHFEILMELNLRMIKENAPMVWMRESAKEYKKFFVVWW